jgi:hypothetical protein
MVLEAYPSTQIRDGMMSYLSAPGLRARLGRRWARSDLRRIIVERAGGARVDADAVAFGWIDPQDVLRFLRAAGDARVASARMEDGEDVTVYAATVAPARALELMAPDAAARPELASLLPFSGERVPVEVGIDDARRIRSVKIDAARTMLLLSFSYDGAQAPIPLPPARDVQDVTDEALAEQYGLAPA